MNFANFQISVIVIAVADNANVGQCRKKIPKTENGEGNHDWSIETNVRNHELCLPNMCVCVFCKKKNLLSTIFCRKIFLNKFHRLQRCYQFLCVSVGVFGAGYGLWVLLCLWASNTYTHTLSHFLVVHITVVVIRLLLLWFAVFECHIIGCTHTCIAWELCSVVVYSVGSIANESLSKRCILD